jgi:hypothetical protein
MTTTMAAASLVLKDPRSGPSPFNLSLKKDARAPWPRG